MGKNRFTVLDSWRGIAALAVVAFHFRRRVGLDGHPLFDSMFLFVDFFFVLSGFVIFSAYGKKLEEGFGFKRFLWLRLGRIYPLHLFTLLVFILANVVMVYPVKGEWFPSPRQSWDTVAANLLLVQSWGLYDFLTWNTPSWSISAEFFAYIAFALVIPLTLRKFWLVCTVVSVAAPLSLVAFNEGKYLDATWGLGIVRCLYGFCVGILTYELYRQLPKLAANPYDKMNRWTIIEVITVLLIFAFISAAGAGPLSLAAPLAFGVIVIVFAHEAGACSKILSWRPLAFLGLISYSIYMVHMLILSWWLATARIVLYKIGGENLFLDVIEIFQVYIFMEGQNYTGLVLMLLVVVAVASVTYFLVEKPTRNWSRRSTLFTSTLSKARGE